MAGSIQRFTFAAVALPILFVAMTGMARAATIIVNTLDGGSQYGLCTLEDAVVAAETQAAVHACAAGSGHHDTIQFSVSGTIFIANTLSMKTPGENLTIVGPVFNGITINGQTYRQLMDVETTGLSLENLTLTEGSAESGGAMYINLALVSITGCTFTSNGAFDGGAIFAGGVSGVSVLNSTFTSNLASDGGGAIYNVLSGLSVTNVTFSGNQSGSTPPGDGAPFPPSGTGACVNNHLGLIAVKSSIFARSVRGGNCVGITDHLGYNLSDDNSCGFSGTSENSVSNLNLDGLALNGGPTETVAPGYGSRAIDFVPIAKCTIVANVPLKNDQRGLAAPTPPTSTSATPARMSPARCPPSRSCRAASACR